MGGEVIALASIIDRTTGNVDIDVISSIKLEIETYDPDDCPMCRQGIEYIKPGSRNIK